MQIMPEVGLPLKEYANQKLLNSVQELWEQVIWCGFSANMLLYHVSTDVSPGVWWSEKQELQWSKHRRRWMSAQDREFALPLPFYSIWAHSSLKDAHPHWWGWISSPSLLNQMLIFSKNTLTDSPRNSVLPTIWAFFRSINWHIKLTITLNN